MSSAHSTSPQDTGDDIKMGKIVLVGAVSLASFAISAVVAWLILDADVKGYESSSRGIAPLPLAKDLNAKEEIGIIDFVPFDTDTRLAKWRARIDERKNGYGWVDRAKGIVHIPVEQGMKEVIRRAKEGGAPTP